jgi:phosphoribosyl-ATP pyrophosphohydrolase
MVMLAWKDLSPDDILDELARRFGISGHDEKASRT